ncbi:MAG: hypothetical protein HXS47_01670 [Theionarchaea archaeon]|nr:hypothetical protein [Theionarchaea archaeon]
MNKNMRFMNRNMPFSYTVIQVAFSLIITYIIFRYTILYVFPEAPFNWLFLPTVVMFFFLLLGTKIYTSRKSTITENTFTIHNYTCDWDNIARISIKKSDYGNPYLTCYFKDNSLPKGFDIEYIDTATLLQDLHRIASEQKIILDIDDQVEPVLKEPPPEHLSFFESLKEGYTNTREEALQKHAEKISKKDEDRDSDITLTPLQKNMILIILAVAFFVWVFIEFGTFFGISILLILFVHEGGHILALNRAHLQTKAVVFIPFVGAGVIPKKGFPSPTIEAAVALAGPLAGLSLNIVGLLLYEYHAFTLLILKFVMICLPLNFLVNVINLLPVSPLDGGRMIKAALLRGKISFAFLLLCSVIIGIFSIITLKSIIIPIIVFLGIGTLVQHYQSITSSEIDPPSRKNTILILGAWMLLIILYWVTLPAFSKQMFTELFPLF